MANEIVKIILEAVDQASKDIKAVGKAAAGLKANFKELASQIPGVDKALAIITNPLAQVGAGLVAVTKFTADSTRETITYAKTVRDLAQNLNISTEETSRLIQTADDYGISVGNIETAMKMALKNGFAPSIDTLAQMADKYNAITDPTQRAAELTKVFGRNWAELTPMLKEGGDAIREAADAQSDSLIITEENAKSARDYEKAVDALGDTFQGFKYAIGKDVIPVLTGLIEALNKSIEKQQDLNKAYDEGKTAAIVTAKSYAEYRAETIRVASATGKMKTVMGDGVDIEAQMAEAAGVMSEEEWKLAQAVEKAKAEVVVASDVGAGYAQTLTKEVVPAVDDAIAAQERLQEEQEKSKQYLSDLKDLLNTSVGDAYDNFKGKNDELQTKIADLNGKIAELESKKYLTPEQQTELDGLKGELDEANKAVADNALAWDKATAKIVYDLALQRAQADGTVSDIEYQLLTKLAGDLGLVDEKTQTTMTNIDKAFYALEHGASMSTVLLILQGIKGNLEEIDGFTANATVNITTHGSIPQITTPNQSTTGKPGQPQEYASGADFVVPPGFSNDTWGPMYASSGERVTVTPGGGASAGNNQELINAIYSTRLNEARLAKLIRDGLLQVM